MISSEEAVFSNREIEEFVGVCEPEQERLSLIREKKTV